MSAALDPIVAAARSGLVVMATPGLSAAVGLSLLAAAANAVASLLSKRLTRSLPARQLIGPLLACNALLLAPAAPFVPWTLTPTIMGLHMASAVAIGVTSLAVWDLFDHGAASATATAQSLSPLPAALATALLLPQAFEPLQGLVAVVVVGAVLVGLADAFGTLGRRRTALTVLLAATGTGLLTVLGRLLLDQGVGIVETYVVRTTLAAAFFLVVVPPRDIPLREAPRLALRALWITAHFVLVLLAVERASPAVVQTATATAPLLVLGYESLTERRWPGARPAGAAGLAMAGVTALLW